MPGEKVERSQLYKQFSAVINNMWDIVYRTLKFSGFNLVVSRFLLCFLCLFKSVAILKQIKLGDLMQTLQVFGKLHSNLSFFRNSYDGFCRIQSHIGSFDRLWLCD